MAHVFALPDRPAVPIAGSHVTEGAIELTVNGAVRQHGDVADLIWDGAETIAYLSRFERPLPGDAIVATIARLEPLRVAIGDREGAFA